MRTDVIASEHSTRNRLVAIAVMACFTMAAFGAKTGAPWYWMLIVALPGLAALASWFANTRSGWRIGPQELYFYQGGTWDLRLRPDQVLWASIQPDSDGPDRVTLHLQSGSSRQLPDDCVGKAWELCDALEEAGVEIRHT